MAAAPPGGEAGSTVDRSLARPGKGGRRRNANHHQPGAWSSAETDGTSHGLLRHVRAADNTKHV